MKLWQQTTGSGDVPLMLIHGWGMNAAVWDPLLAELEPLYQVTRVDLPGHGLSKGLPEPNDLQHWARALLDIAPDNAIWLGWSMGGLLALQAALLEPQRLRGLFMMTATPCFAQRSNWTAAMPKKTLQQFAVSLQADADATLMRFLSLQVKGCEHARDLLKQLKQEFASRPQATDEALQTGLEFLLHEDLRESLKRLRVPVQWLLGGRDTLVPGSLQQALLQIDADIPVSLIKDAAHVPFFSHTAEVLQLLNDLLVRTRVASA